MTKRSWLGILMGAIGITLLAFAPHAQSWEERVTS